MHIQLLILNYLMDHLIIIIVIKIINLKGEKMKRLDKLIIKVNPLEIEEDKRVNILL